MIRKLLPLVVVLMCACAIHYYAPYDAETESRLAALQAQTNMFYATAEDVFYATTDDALDMSNTMDAEIVHQFYLDVQDEIGELLTRAESFLNNTDTINQLKLLRESFQNAEELHGLGFSSVYEIKLIRSGLNSHFRAVLTLEQAKKRGDK